MRRPIPVGNGITESPWIDFQKLWGLSSSGARLAWMRRVDPKELAWRLDPSWSRATDPFLLEGVSAAVARIHRAISKNENICIYGDYDVDGVTATAIMVRVLERFGIRANFFIPNRFSDGYGINLNRIKELVEVQGTSLIISVDCGIRSVAEVEASRGMGVDWIITDHHTIGSELPQATAVVHPMLGEYCNPHLAGVGVAFKLAHALLGFATLPTGKDQDFLDSMLKLVALGTVADMAPLVGENAWLVKRGLIALSSRRNGPGITELLSAAKVEGRVRSQHISFGIGPRINAVGRMGEASDAVKLLLTREADEARTLIKRVESANLERREIQKTLSAMLPLPCGKSFDLVIEPSAHKGVVGIVAGQRMRATGRPSAVGTVVDGVAHCSVRAPDGYDLRLILDLIRPLVISGGGHRYAASFSFCMSQLNAIREAIELSASEQANGIASPSILVDGIGTAMVPSVNELESLEPFGQLFPEPLFIVKGPMAAPAKLFGKGHQKLRIVGEDCDFTMFNQGENSFDMGEILNLVVAPMDHIRWGRSWRIDALAAPLSGL
jgi:single-stranded-DNA-specific exonuclease